MTDSKDDLYFFVAQYMAQEEDLAKLMESLGESVEDFANVMRKKYPTPELLRAALESFGVAIAFTTGQNAILQMLKDYDKANVKH